MGEEVLAYTATIPAGTAKATPVTINLPIFNWDIESLDLQVPTGPNGLMGFYLALSGEQWIPHVRGQYLVWNDHFQNWPLTKQPTNKGWQVVGYNTDVYDHSVFLRFHVNSLSPPQQPASPSLTIITQPLAGSTSIL